MSKVSFPLGLRRELFVGIRKIFVVMVNEYAMVVVMVNEHGMTVVMVNEYGMTVVMVNEWP